MTADQIVTALTASGKPITAARWQKAQARADSPTVWLEVQTRIAAPPLSPPSDPAPSASPTAVPASGAS